MLKDHKNFRFTPIPDKTNDMIFLKSPKTLFLDHFGHFCPMGIFSKKSGSVIHAKFQKKTNEPLLRKLSDIRKDEAGGSKRKGARIWFFSRLLPANVIDFF